MSLPNSFLHPPESDIQTTVAFLTTRVKSPGEDDWGKLKRVLKYLNGTQHLHLTLTVDSLSSIQWYINGWHQINDDCHSHTGALRQWAVEPLQAHPENKIKAKYLVQDKYNQHQIDLKYCCPTNTKWADILIKPLQGQKFQVMRMNCPLDYLEKFNCLLNSLHHSLIADVCIETQAVSLLPRGIATQLFQLTAYTLDRR